jgi:hypothetical protein
VVLISGKSKLAEIFRRNSIADLNVAQMEVPCCSVLKWVIDTVTEVSGKQIPVKRLIVVWMVMFMSSKDNW